MHMPQQLGGAGTYLLATACHIIIMRPLVRVLAHALSQTAHACSLAGLCMGLLPLLILLVRTDMYVTRLFLLALIWASFDDCKANVWLSYAWQVLQLGEDGKHALGSAIMGCMDSHCVHS